jgi:STE24 endopeptidase
MQIFSRKNEYEADQFAADTTKDPQNMISALKKLSADNLSNLTPHPFYVFLNYSHPPVLQRIEALKSNQ